VTLHLRDSLSKWLRVTR